MTPPCGPCTDFQLVFECQPIALGILTQPNRYKRAESNLLADEKGLNNSLCYTSIFIDLFILGLLGVCRRLLYGSALSCS